MKAVLVMLVLCASMCSHGTVAEVKDDVVNGSLGGRQLLQRTVNRDNSADKKTPQLSPIAKSDTEPAPGENPAASGLAETRAASASTAASKSPAPSSIVTIQSREDCEKYGSDEKKVVSKKDLCCRCPPECTKYCYCKTGECADHEKCEVDTSKKRKSPTGFSADSTRSSGRKMLDYSLTGMSRSLSAITCSPTIGNVCSGCQPLSDCNAFHWCPPE